MALFKTFKGLSENLMTNRPKAIEGYAYFTTDDGKFYIDIAGTPTSNTTAVIGTNRIPLNANKADFAGKIPYAVNNQNAIVYNKVITTSDPFTLTEGNIILIKFTDSNPGGETQQNNAITFNVNGTGSRPVYYRSRRMPNEFISQNKIYIFRVNTYLNTDNNQNEFIYDLVGDVVPDLGGNETVITTADGQMTSAPLSDRFQIVQTLPTTNIDDNIVYLVPNGTYSGSSSGSGSGSGSGLTYTLSKSGSTITLTASNGVTSSVSDVGLTQAQVQALIDATITTALSTAYPSL